MSSIPHPFGWQWVLNLGPDACVASTVPLSSTHSPTHLVLCYGMKASFVTLLKTRVTWEGETSSEKFLHQTGLEAYLWEFFFKLLLDSGGHQLTVGGDSPRQMGLGCTKSLAGKARGSRSLSNMFLWSLCSF